MLMSLSSFIFRLNFGKVNYMLNYQYVCSKFSSNARDRNCEYYYFVNSDGFKWKCNLRWSPRRPTKCYITYGWKVFYTDNGLRAGDTIQIGVYRNVGNRINVVKIN